MKEPLDHITNYFDKDLNILNHELYIGEVDAPMADRITKGMSTLIQTQGVDNVLLTINSPGGEVYNGMAIYDVVKYCPLPTIAHCLGHVMSMSSVILQAAAYRFLSPNCTLMLHYGSMGVDDIHSKDFAVEAKENERMGLVVEHIYLKKIQEKHKTFTLKNLRDKMKFNWYLSAYDAVKYGLADAIVEDINVARKEVTDE